MTEGTNTNGQQEQEEDGSRKPIIDFMIIAVSFLTLSLAASIVIMLLPLGVLPRGVFPGNAERALWLLFILGLAFGIVLFTLGATKRSRWMLSRGGGPVDLTLGFLCAIEIFLLRAYTPTASTKSLWWLFVALTVLGALGVYLPVRAKRLADEEEKRKADEAKCEALAKQRRIRPTVIRLKIRRYYIREKKLLDCRD